MGVTARIGAATGRSIVALLVATVLVTACQGGSSAIVHPTGANELVLRIETGGGFVPASFIVGRIPELSVFDDGRVIVQGPQDAIFPGPALPDLVTFRLSEDGLRALLENARTAGLLGADAQYDYPGIADAGTTTFTVIAEGQRHVVSAYALVEGGPLDAQLDPEVRRARAALLAFQQRALDMRSWLGQAIVEPDSAYGYELLRVFVSAAEPQEPAEIEPSFADWPLATPLATFGSPLADFAEMRCGVVRGDDLATLRPALEGSNQLTFWRSQAMTYQLTLRPLLPDESGCPAGT